MGYTFMEGDFPSGENGYEGMFVIGQDSLYSYTDKKGNYFQQTTKADGTPADPPVDVMNDKLTLTINKSDETNTKKQPSFKITCTGILTSDYQRNPSTYGVFMDIHYVKSLEKSTKSTYTYIYSKTRLRLTITLS